MKVGSQVVFEWTYASSQCQGVSHPEVWVQNSLGGKQVLVIEGRKELTVFEGQPDDQCGWSGVSGGGGRAEAHSDSSYRALQSILRGPRFCSGCNGKPLGSLAERASGGDADNRCRLHWWRPAGMADAAESTLSAHVALCPGPWEAGSAEACACCCLAVRSQQVILQKVAWRRQRGASSH